MATSSPSKGKSARNQVEKAVSSTDHQLGQAHSDDDDHDQHPEPAPTRASKKRTKSGCLTCRKRRIKCDEARPTCQNCTKSKRHCDGYFQRVLFKPANIDFRHFQNGATAITFPPGTLAMPMDLEALQQQSTFAGQPQLRPRPVPEYAPSTQPYSHPYQNSQSPQNTQLNFAAGTSDHVTDVQAPVWSTRPPPASFGLSSSDYSNIHQPQTMVLQPPFVAGGCGQNQNMHVVPSSLDSAHYSQLAHQHRPSVPPANMPLQAQVRHDQVPYPDPTFSTPCTYSQQDTYQRSRDSVTSESQFARDKHSSISELAVDPASPDLLLAEAVTEVQDDDYYDVNSDDEMELDSQTAPYQQHKLHQTLGLAMRMGRVDLNEMTLGMYDSSGILDTYRPERTANPLKNPMTARVFAHFIRITAPSIATFIRRPKQNRAPAHGNGTIPFSEQGIWTFAMPMASLHHQGLLQAILAVSSFHIARLTGASTTPSYKHYAYALKRIHASLSHPDKRHSVPVLAASLLLAIYELWSADHVKWNSHLAGAAQLLAEIDFRSTYKQFRRLKADQIRQQQQQYGHLHTSQPFEGRLWDEINQVPDADPHLVSILTGRVVDYDEFGHIENEHNTQNPGLASVDIPKFEMQKDLFWWFTKQDVVQCLVSGNPLLMSYSRWTNCPPRAPIGDPQAVYGSLDYLMLLLGRIADFTVRDRKRKLQKIQATGGQWRPAPGMQMGPSPPARGANPQPTSGPTPSPSSQGTPSPPRMPDFFGMAPVPPQSGMPSSYGQHASKSASVSPSWTSHDGLEMKTKAALEEWEQIRTALLHFRSVLGPHFQPLEGRTFETPFGPALLYRNYDIGCFWSYYFLSMIVLIRAHPDMPPHAQVAAGVAAYQTREFANDIGRAAAGITVPPEQETMSPSLMATITEHTLPMFFSGVQYQSPHQREWLVTRMFDVERRCGFATAGTMALGCQRAWIKAHEMGRGPPHELRINPQAMGQRVIGVQLSIRGRELPPSMVDDNTDRRFVAVKPQTRLHWAIGILGEEDDG